MACRQDHAPCLRASQIGCPGLWGPCARLGLSLIHVEDSSGWQSQTQGGHRILYRDSSKMAPFYTLPQGAVAISRALVLHLCLRFLYPYVYDSQYSE